ncbi:hypothetical protein MKX08_006305 [Trichoderma sp. CBMAI-0020]|nr:hypothetical protein MKX08_006305 [Trichoderma sp. CBMAI-0020]
MAKTSSIPVEASDGVSAAASLGPQHTNNGRRISVQPLQQKPSQAGHENTPRMKLSGPLRGTQSQCCSCTAIEAVWFASKTPVVASRSPDNKQHRLDARSTARSSIE